MAVKTYGELIRGSVGGGEVQFGVRAVPHVAAHIKRLFPRAYAGRPGIVTMRDTREVARDLEWFMLRWPLNAAPEVMAYVASRAGEHRATEQAVADILGGYRPPTDLREPAVKPRDYQLQADAIVAATGRLLNGDDVGLGKTFTSLLRLRDPDALPAAIVTPTQLPVQWLRELNRFLPWLTGHIARRRAAYDPADHPDCGGRSPDVILLPYSKLSGWADFLAGRIRTVIYDEAQHLRTGEGTDKWAAAVTLADKAMFKIGCSATPVYNYGDEIWNIFRVLDPDALGTRDEFIREWCGGSTGQAGHHPVRNPAMLGGYLRDMGLMLVRTRKDLHMELPDPIQIEQPVDTDHAAIDEVAASVSYQAQILTGQIEAGFTERGQAARDIDWKMRRITGVAKAPYVAQFVRLLLESQDRVLIAGWHRDVYDIWLHELAEYNPVLYTGTETPAQKQRSVAAFCGGGSRVMMMSLRSGEGLDGLQRHCSVAVFGELDWSPEVHYQLIGRLARDGQESTVAAFYMTSDDGTDPLMAEVLGIKRAQAVPIRNPDTPLFTALTPETDRHRELAASVLARVAQRQTKGARR